MMSSDIELKPYTNDDTYIELHRLYLKCIQKYSARGFIKYLHSLIVKGEVKSSEEDSVVELQTPFPHFAVQIPLIPTISGDFGLIKVRPEQHASGLAITGTVPPSPTQLALTTKGSILT